jgi:hypothetical protein
MSLLAFIRVLAVDRASIIAIWPYEHVYERDEGE